MAKPTMKTKLKVVPYQRLKKRLKYWHYKTQIVFKMERAATQNPARLSFESAATAIAVAVMETQPKLRRMNASADLSDYADPPRVSVAQYDCIEEAWQRELDAILNRPDSEAATVSSEAIAKGDVKYVSKT